MSWVQKAEVFTPVPFATIAALPVAASFPGGIAKTTTPNVLWVSDGTTWNILSGLGSYSGYAYRRGIGTQAVTTVTANFDYAAYNTAGGPLAVYDSFTAGSGITPVAAATGLFTVTRTGTYRVDIVMNGLWTTGPTGVGSLGAVVLDTTAAAIAPASVGGQIQALEVVAVVANGTAVDFEGSLYVALVATHVYKVAFAQDTTAGVLATTNVDVHIALQ